MREEEIRSLWMFIALITFAIFGLTAAITGNGMWFFIPFAVCVFRLGQLTSRD